MNRLARMYPMFPIVGIAAVAILSNPATAGPTLPDAVSYEYFGLNFADNVLTSSAVGTLDYSGQPGCGGTCIATTALGAVPSVSANVNEVVYQATSGGVVQASLGYYVEYVNTPGTYNVDLHSANSLSVNDGITAMSAALTFGTAGTKTTSLGNFSAVTLQEADCINGCPAPGFVTSTGPFAPIQSVQMVANTPYFVQMDLLIRSQPSGTQQSGTIDPTFSASSGGQFIFSPGVLPEGGGETMQAPEIDASAAASGVSLLAGCLLVFRGRRSRNLQTVKI
jgi:hypothetical protein